MNPYMKEANDLAKQNFLTDDGGPFGAAIIRNGEIIGRGNNQVVKSSDPTAHAENVFVCNHMGKYKNCILWKHKRRCRRNWISG